MNANMGDVINWFEDSESMLVKMISKDRKELIDVENAVPTGPTITVSDGKKAQNRTYQDFLKTKMMNIISSNWLYQKFTKYQWMDVWKIGLEVRCIPV